MCFVFLEELFEDLFLVFWCDVDVLVGDGDFDVGIVMVMVD